MLFFKTEILIIIISLEHGSSSFLHEYIHQRSSETVMDLIENTSSYDRLLQYLPSVIRSISFFQVGCVACADTKTDAVGK